MSDTDVDTLVENQIDKNTEAEVEVEETVNNDDNNNTSTDNGTDSDTGAQDLKTDKIDTNIVDMSDDEFLEFINSNKLKEKEKETDPDKTEETEAGPENKKPEKEDVTEQKTTEVTETKSQVKEPTAKSDKSNEKLTVDNIDFKEVYNTIFKPFKANGKEITPKTAEDVVSLMQMGANYTKKMQLISPIRKTYESLSQAGVKTDEDLNFLIDLHKGDQEAIKKLLQKHKVEPLEIDLDTTNYVPKNNLVSDDDVKYAEVLEDISDSLPKIDEIINRVWDPESKKQILKDPKYLKALHEEIVYGRFDKIQSEVETHKTFGRYKDVSDLEAYLDVLQKQLAKQPKEAAVKPATTAYKQPTNTTPVPDKTKAAPTRGQTTNSKKSTLTPEDLLSMPEEEFLKLSIKDLV